MKIRFRKIKMGKPNLVRLETINTIIEGYQKQGLVLTLRQLYYQLVSGDIVPNTHSEYKKLGNLLKEGRMAGIVDWEAIEDRLRRPSSPSSWTSPKDGLQAIIQQYQCPRQDGQPTYMEVWVEKDALSGVLSRVTRKYHIPILVCRGYSSATAMFDSYNRFKRAHRRGQNVRLLYVGDFDPSGEDMVRDIFDRVTEFANGDETYEYTSELDFTIDKIALTKPQITRYKPPPNPAKITDPRAKEFIKKHGNQSWEVDALKPEVLNQILENAIAKHIDMDIYESVLKAEVEDIAILKKLDRQLK